MIDDRAELDGSPDSSRVVIEEVLRQGARRLLQQAIECEVQEFVERFEGDRDAGGHRTVVRNGWREGRDILTSLGPLPVRQPRVDDRKLRARGDEGFVSQLLPRYLRRIPSVDNLIPALYLKGIATQDFPEALAPILGEEAKGLSANVVVRLKQKWETEYEQWNQRDLTGKRFAFLWVDGIYFNVRLDDERSCVLVVIAADTTGKKELLAVADGYRESKDSWRELLLDLQRRGLTMDPSLAIGDGGLGFWAACREVFGSTREQLCWVHKTKNVMDKLPKAVQGRAKSLVHEMYLAPTREKAMNAFNHFTTAYQAKYPKAVDCLSKDRDRLFTFYDFPAEQWIHIRSINAIESTFATVRLRTRRTKGAGSRMAALTMVFKLAREAQKRWHRLQGYNLIPLVLQGVRFVDGEADQAA